MGRGYHGRAGGRGERQRGDVPVHVVVAVNSDDVNVNGVGVNVDLDGDGDVHGDDLLSSTTPLKDTRWR